ncbi:MAG: asparagine synthase (glutamine-hydrolyzing) [Anaerolineales bacterium]|nr:asparagine synthase (glutamine-hydrolyzing) [Anaerolineales bacterium]
MCGIVGVFNQTEERRVDKDILLQMLGLIRHRGPDGFGVYQDEKVSLGSTRLSIIDISGGDQPISNENGSMWIVFNGEIFNYIELRPGLEAKGHRFSTNSDTEVIVHLFEEYGAECLNYLNGQFAFAIWDANRRELFLARDRLGIRPLFYTEQGGQLIFGSEIKTILAYPGVRAEIDLHSLDQVFTYWSTLSPRTIFRDIFEVPPGHYMLIRGMEKTVRSYWSLDFSASNAFQRSIQEYQDELEALLIDSTRIRLRADVPVGAYLSGGLDSSTTTAIIRNFTDTPLDTFSISFSDPEFDESPFQRQMAEFLGTQHQVVYITHEDIGDLFPNVIWHTEIPILRTAPAPLYRLSELVRDNHYKVVVTGEGADEFLAGYDIYKEAMIRRFWARQPQSNLRPLLFNRLYPEISHMPNSQAYLASFFGAGLLDTQARDYSHQIRWRATSRAKRFFSDQARAYLNQSDGATVGGVKYPPGFDDWDALSQAQYLESTIFLPQYLLSSQGDRVAMAHSVEGRFPFLDYRVVEFCAALPPALRLNGLVEKYLLRRIARKWLPDEIWKRRKRPYRAPIHRSFVREDGSTPDYVEELLSPSSLKAAGLFNPEAVQQLLTKLKSGKRVGETDDMALAGIISSQLVWRQFTVDFQRLTPAPIRFEELKRDCSRQSVVAGGQHAV